MRIVTETNRVDRETAAAGLSAVGREFYERGWSRATSSNYSVRLSDDPLRLLLTVSGKDKGALGPDDFVIVDDQGQPIESDGKRSSAETMLHVVLAEQVGAGSILHTHSTWGTILSDLCAIQGAVTLSGYEMLKALPGIDTHDTSIRIPVFPNTQDISALAEEVRIQLADNEQPLEYGFLIHKHGLYTWGDTLQDARRHVEMFEFLFECEARLRLHSN